MVLKNNDCKLTYLDLKHKVITDKDIESIHKAIKNENYQLKFINLERNNFRVQHNHNILLGYINVT
jgi:hypothetical protein